MEENVGVSDFGVRVFLIITPKRGSNKMIGELEDQREKTSLYHLTS